MNLLEGNSSPSPNSPAKTTDLINMDSNDNDPEIKGNDLFNNLNINTTPSANQDYKPPTFEEKQQMLIGS